MITEHRLFRVFLSSTFGDFKAERAALHKNVFPKIAEQCRKSGFDFQLIDMQWGISEEAGKSLLTVPICLEEIKHCQLINPRINFIALVGDRYGWRPLPLRIPEAEFEIIDSYAGDARAILHEYYELDRNALNSEYVQKPRDIQDEKQRLADERKIRKIIKAALPHFPIKKEAKCPGSVYGRKIKPEVEYIGSVTEWKVKREVEYIGSVTEKEIQKGIFEAPIENIPICCIRDISGELKNLDQERIYRDVFDSKADSEEAAEAFHRVHAMKTRIKEKLGSQVLEYTSHWTKKSISGIHIKRLCDDVKKRLWECLQDEIGKIKECQASYKPGKVEKEQVDDFISERTQVFVGRQPELEQLNRYAIDPSNKPFFVFGKSGSGKSSLMAKFADSIRGTHKNNCIVVHFAGSTPDSSELRLLLQGICNEIIAAYKLKGDEYKELENSLDIRKLFPGFQKCISAASSTQPLFIILDALDQLSLPDRAITYYWIPETLPPWVKMVVSGLPDVRDILTHCLTEFNEITLGGMSDKDAADLLEKWLREDCRMLQGNQQQCIEKTWGATRYPLHLRLIFERVRRWRSFDKPSPVATDASSMILDLFHELSRNENHGEVLVKSAIQYLFASKKGLADAEMQELISRDSNVRADLDERFPNSPKVGKGEPLPAIFWSRLYFDLLPYLTIKVADRTRVFEFFHREFSRTAKPHYLKEAENQSIHRKLAGYFDSKMNQSNKEKGPISPRVLSELPYHLIHSGKLQEAADLLGCFDFLNSKNKEFGPHELLEDLDSLHLSAQKGDSLNSSSAERISLIHDAIQKSIYALDGDSTQFISQLYGRLISKANNASLEALIKQMEQYREPWLMPLGPTLFQADSALKNSIALHKHPVRAAIVLSDGKSVVSGSDGFDDSGKDDSSIVIWNLETGAQRKRPGSITVGVRAIVEDMKNARFYTAHNDGTITMWTLTGNSLDEPLKGHEADVSSLAIRSDGTLFSGSYDKTIRIWDTRGRSSTVFPTEHSSGVNSLCHAKESNILVSASNDHTIIIWDTSTHSIIRKIECHDASVNSVCFSTGEDKIISGSSDKTVRISPIKGNGKIVIMEGHNAIINSVCCFMHKGKEYIVSGDWDGVLCVWDLDKAELLGRLLAHTYHINNLVPVTEKSMLSSDSEDTSPEKGVLISASEDTSVKVWSIPELVTQGKLLQGKVLDRISMLKIDSDHSRLEAYKVPFDISHIPDVQIQCSNECSNENKSIQCNSNRNSLMPLRKNNPWEYGNCSYIWDLNNMNDKLREGFIPHRCKIGLISGFINGGVPTCDSISRIVKIPDVSVFNKLSCMLHNTSILHNNTWSMIRGWCPKGVLDILCSPEEKIKYGGSGVCSASKLLYIYYVPTPGNESNQSLRMIDLQTAQEIEWKAHKDFITMYLISPDGTTLYTSSKDYSILKWDISKGTAVKPPPPIKFEDSHSREVNCIAISQDGKRLLSVSDDYSAILWDITPKKPRFIARFMAEGPLTLCAISTKGDKSLVIDEAGRVHTLSTIS